jgi:hypothetical protein
MLVFRIIGLRNDDVQRPTRNDERYCDLHAEPEVIRHGRFWTAAPPKTRPARGSTINCVRPFPTSITGVLSGRRSPRNKQPDLPRSGCREGMIKCISLISSPAHARSLRTESKNSESHFYGQPVHGPELFSADSETSIGKGPEHL